MTNRTYSPLRRAQEAALARGDKTFTFSEPCRNGHIAPRHSSNGNCTACHAEHNRNRYRKPDHQRQLKLTLANGRVTQLTQDQATLAAIATVRDKVVEVAGRPPSLSLLHKAGIKLLAAYMNNAPVASSVMALFS